MLGAGAVCLCLGALCLFWGRSQVSVFRLIPAREGTGQPSALLCTRGPGQQHTGAVSELRGPEQQQQPPLQHHEDPAPGSQQHLHHRAEAGAGGKVGATGQKPWDAASCHE